MSAAADMAGTPKFVSTQEDYSLLNHHGAAGLLAECERIGACLLPYRPLYDGLLTGKYRPGAAPLAGTRIAAKDKQRQAVIFSERNMTIVAGLTEYAAARDRTLLELAIGWLVAQPTVGAVIAGVRSGAQVSANVAAARWELTATELAEIEEIARLSD
jgi:aryl-alcohol dehydrogenase-like predicted oxidoreductase